MKNITEMKKGNTAIVCGFTGIKLGVFVVEAATDKSITIMKKDGNKMIFSKKTGKQTNVEEGKEKYANKITIDDGSYVAPVRKAKAEVETKAPAKKAKKKPVVDVDYEDDDEEEEEIPEPKKAKKLKKTAKKPEVIEDDDEDEYEEA